MKDRITASILAIFVGGLGIHRFYLGQTGRGILCILTIPISLWVAPAIGVYWLLSSNESFDNSYNRQRLQRQQADIQKEILNKLK
jgi:TM2 domain-containing membrane protein YozV